jgi:uncharacterized protein with PIN domain
MGNRIRFAVDSMLGTLAKWLRILGYDTTYYPRIQDRELVRLSRVEDRILLTRDSGLSKRKGLCVLLIESQILEEQLTQVADAFGLQMDKPFSRCPVCNASLEDVPKDEAWGQVPTYVFHTQEKFSLCPECKRFYWRGTHWRRMASKVGQLKR